MTHTIENEFLQVSVNDHGAELCSIFDKEKNREVIWQADPAFWKRHAPVLFPNVGRHYLDHFRTLGSGRQIRLSGNAMRRFFSQMWDAIIWIISGLSAGNFLPNSTALPGTVSLSVPAEPRIPSPMC